jgi:prepilin-type N-terminal cleavage/methylation domain-containing protein
MRRHGFTLIELLVVVSIIALLISILLPSLRKAREQAVVVACGTQLKQVGQGMMMYGLSNRNLLPMPLYYNGALWGTALKASYLDAYNNEKGHGGFGRLIDSGDLDAFDLYVCPAVRSDWPTTWWSPYTLRITTPDQSNRLDPNNWRFPDRGTFWLSADMYSAGGNHDRTGLNVLYSDHHVAWETPDWDLLAVLGYAWLNQHYDQGL